MSSKEDTCGELALQIFNNTKCVPGSRPSVVEMQRLLGPTAVCDERQAGVTCGAWYVSSKNRIGANLLYVKRGQHLTPSPSLSPSPSHSHSQSHRIKPQWLDRRLLLVTWMDRLYPAGHCLVIIPPEDPTQLHLRWRLHDPWRKEGTAVLFKRRQIQQFLLVADFILYLKKE
jgi:hypothetical protein